MAVTIHQSPKAVTPSDNDVLWTFSSDQTGQPNFEYKVEILIDNVVSFIGKVFPISGNVSYFNATEILRGLIPAPNIDSSPNVALDDADDLLFSNTSQRIVSLKVTERYGSTIADQASATSFGIRVWKSALSELQWLGFDWEKYKLANSSRLFMTNFPRNRKYWVTKQQNNYLGLINLHEYANIFNYQTGEAPTLAAFEAQIGFPLINGAKFGDTILFDNVGYELGSFQNEELTGFLKCSAENILGGGFLGNTITDVYIPFAEYVGDSAFAFNQIKKVFAPVCLIASDACFAFNNIQYFNAPIIQQIGNTTGEDGFFANATGNNVTVIVPIIHQTSNGGNLEGDLQYLDDNNTVTFDWDGQEVPDWINDPIHPINQLNFNYFSDDDFDGETYDPPIQGVGFINVSMKHWATVNGSEFDKFATFYFTNDAGGDISERFTFHILEPCNESRTVFFINKLGAIDSWTFTARKQVNRTFERSTFKKKFGTLQGNNYVYDSFEGRHQNYHNASTSVETLDSDWLFPDVHAWLVRELLESPLVWTEDENGIKTRWVIENASSEEGQDRTDVWMQLSLEMKPTLQSYSATL